MTDTLGTTTGTYLRAPTADTEDLVARFGEIFADIADGDLERQQQRSFPYDQVAALKAADFGLLRIPEEFGGLGASLEQTFTLLAALGAADPNVAHVWRNHLAFVEDRLNAPVSAAGDRWLERFRGGEFVGGGWTEANNGTFANIATTVRRDGDLYRVNGAKFYATGSLYADWLDVLGASDDGFFTALVRRDDPGVRLTDDWTGFGQQTTASGSADYTDAAVDPDNVYPLSERFVYQGHFYQVAVLAVLAGISAAAARDLDAVAAAHAAGDVVRRDESTLNAQLSTDRAQLVVIKAALSVTTEVFDALGASGVSTGLALDRHWRNARTLASHNPRVYKARIVGDYLVNGTDPRPNLFGGSGVRGGQGN
ncbi:MAG: acyl-CoA dehydrogenase [Gordonia sp. (in: high G+C Gram-positive bacteria)]